MSSDDIEIPVLEEVIFPSESMLADNKQTEVIKKEENNAIESSSCKEMQQYLQQQLNEKLDYLVQEAVFQTLQDSIPVLAEDIKDMIISKLQPQIADIVQNASQHKKIDNH